MVAVTVNLAFGICSAPNSVEIGYNISTVALLLLKCDKKET
jgi:hypothetical protein